MATAVSCPESDQASEQDGGVLILAYLQRTEGEISELKIRTKPVISYFNVSFNLGVKYDH